MLSINTEHLTDGTDLYKLAGCVAIQETANCTKGFGLEYNNCHGLKNGNTAPCSKIGKNRMCIYESPNESYKAFKIIWQKWYKRFPDYQLAQKYSGNDRAGIWLNNVTNCYYE